MSFVETDPDVNAAAGEIVLKRITSYLLLLEDRIPRQISGRYVKLATMGCTADEDALGATTTRHGIPQHGGAPRLCEGRVSMNTTAPPVALAVNPSRKRGTAAMRS